jgi:hypothetical protein
VLTIEICPTNSGSDVTLVCNTEAHPVSINYWTKEDEDALLPSDKYEIVNKESTYKVHMTLKIRNFSAADYGKYRCFARNSLGSTEGSIRVYGKQRIKVKWDGKKLIKVVHDLFNRGTQTKHGQQQFA